MKEIIKSFRILMVCTVFFGLAYPLLMTGLSLLLMPDRANGSLSFVKGSPVGSLLIGQEFTNEKYFHSRPSSIHYDALNSGGRNLGPSSRILMEKTITNIALVRNRNHLPKDQPVPADMVLNSASGLDPHISLTNAMLQVPRIATARHIAQKEVRMLLLLNSDPDLLGLWGRQRVNVLRMNLLLDKIKGDK